MNLEFIGNGLICSSCRYVPAAGVLTSIENVSYVYLHSTRLAIQVPRANCRTLLLADVTVEQLRLYLIAERLGISEIESLSFIPREAVPVNRIMNENNENNEEQEEEEMDDSNLAEEMAPEGNEASIPPLNPNAAEFDPNDDGLGFNYFDRNTNTIRPIPCTPPPSYEELDLTFYNRLDALAREGNPPPSYQKFERSSLYEDISSDDETNSLSDGAGPSNYNRPTNDRNPSNDQDQSDYDSDHSGGVLVIDHPSICSNSDESSSSSSSSSSGESSDNDSSSSSSSTSSGGSTSSNGDASPKK